MTPGATLLVIFACLVAEGFFSGSEIAIVSSRWPRIRREAEKGDRGAVLLLWLWRNPDRLLATTLVGTNLSVIIGSVIATWLAVNAVRAHAAWGPLLAGREELLVILLLTPVTILLGEVVPKSVFQSRSAKLAKRIAYPMAAAWVLFYPVTSVLTLFSGLIKKAVRARVAASPFVTREELAMIVRLRDLKTDLKKHEQRMIRRLFSFRETKVREVMVPLVKVLAFEEGTSLEQALEAFGRFKHTRFPIYRERMFNVVGVLNILACLHEPNLQKKVGRLLEPPYFVPETKSVVDLLRDMERDKVRMAVAVDEYGGTVGIITLEDVLEEIVGELEDEYEVRKSGLKRLDAHRFEADAHLALEYVAEKTGAILPPGEYETLAGLMIHRLGRIPLRGEEVRLPSVTLKALEVSRRTVSRVLLTVSPEPAG